MVKADSSYKSLNSPAELLINRIYFYFYRMPPPSETFSILAVVAFNICRQACVQATWHVKIPVRRSWTKFHPALERIFIFLIVCQDCCASWMMPASAIPVKKAPTVTPARWAEITSAPARQDTLVPPATKTLMNAHWVNVIASEQQTSPSD